MTIFPPVNKQRNPKPLFRKVLGGVEPTDFIFKLHIGDSRSEARGIPSKVTEKYQNMECPLSRRFREKSSLIN